MRLLSGNNGTQIDNGGEWYTNTGQSTWDMCTMPANHSHTTDGYFFIGHKQNSNTYMTSVKMTNSMSNMPGPNHYVGFPKQSYSNGQTATIQTFGSVVDGFSGLKPGWPYYIQPNGTVADQILITGSLQNYSNAQFAGNSAYDSHPEI